MTAQLWGTVSVLDHQRPYAFVAEIGLFDVLVVPVPPAAGTAEWLPRNWDGAAQARLLDAIPNDKLRRVPWNDRQRGEWRQRAAAAQAMFDVTVIQDERRRHIAAGGTIVDFNAMPYHTTRMVLQDFVDTEHDRELLTGMPEAKVTVIPAYDGPASFAAGEGVVENGVAGEWLAGGGAAAVADEPRQARLLRAFHWEFLAPSNEDQPGKALTHRQLIEAAVALEGLPEVREHREAFRAWTSREALRGTEPAEARERMEDLLARYARAVQATGIPVKARRACGVVEVGSAAASIWQPWFGLVGPVMQFLGVREWLGAATELPAEIQPAALLHGMRSAFSQTNVPGLVLDEPMPLPLTRFWQGPIGI